MFVLRYLMRHVLLMSVSLQNYVMFSLPMYSS